MTFSFTVKEFMLGGGTGVPTLQFYGKGFSIGPQSGSQPTWQDIILNGKTALTLTNAKANGLEYLKLFGGCEQNGTPTPSSPVDIVCNNGALKMVDDELPTGYKRVLGYTCNNNVLWQITNFKLRGSDTVRISFSVSAACNVFGCYQGVDATDNYDLYVSTTSGSKYLRYGSGVYLSYWSSANLDKRFDVVFSPNGTSGMPADSTWSPLTFEAVNDLLIGSTTLTGTSSKLKGNLYGNFVVDGRLKLIPCERLSDNSLGYYDTYSETFFEPIGTPTSMGYDSSHYVLTVDGTIETVNVHSPNLFNASSDAVKLGYYVSTSGANKGQELTSSSNFISVNYIPIKPNTSYVLFGRKKSDNTLSAYNRIYWYDANKEYLSVCSYTQNTVTVATSPANAYYAKYGINESGSSSATVTQEIVDSYNWTLCEGDTEPSTFTPYWVGDSATATDLLAIDTDKDVQEVLTGTVTRSIGTRILNGNETYGSSSAYGAAIYIKGIASTWSADRSKAVMCSHFLGLNPVASGTQSDGTCFFNASGHLYFRTSMSAADFKTWVTNQYNAGTPVIILFVKSTDATEHVTAQHLNIRAGTNVVEITQASINDLELKVKYKAKVEEGE